MVVGVARPVVSPCRCANGLGIVVMVGPHIHIEIGRLYFPAIVFGSITPPASMMLQ
jgi:hypothetical protein